MRFIFAFFLGILATFGAAFYHDAVLTGPERATKQLVNWTTLHEVAGNALDRAHDELNRLMAK